LVAAWFGFAGALGVAVAAPDTGDSTAGAPTQRTSASSVEIQMLRPRPIR
jgi:hypothetical protein